MVRVRLRGERKAHGDREREREKADKDERRAKKKVEGEMAHGRRVAPTGRLGSREGETENPRRERGKYARIPNSLPNEQFLFLSAIFKGFVIKFVSIICEFS